MKCPNCGEEAGAKKFCPFCGKPVTTDHGDASETVLRGAGIPHPDQDNRTPERVETPPVGGGETPGSFGRYRVLREVGRGAMGIVYLARDDKIGRSVAIKALRIDAGLPSRDKEQIADRFEREARAAGMLSHPNIVTVHDVGEEGGTPYIAMEYLEGATLTEIASEGPLSIRQATDIVGQVLSALSYAHAHEVVHRDIKPDNIFMLPDGRVKVADFGIARISSVSAMTQVGQVIGTPGYMSPEQVKGEQVGPASDIFSVGVLLYELLTGTAAFGSTSPTSIMYKIVHEEPKPLHVVNSALPAYLEAIVAKATAKSPGDRYADASQMRDDLQAEHAPELPWAAPAAGGTVVRTGPVLPAGGTVLRSEPVGDQGAGGTVLRTAPVPAALPAAPAPEAAAPKKKRTAVLLILGAAAVLIATAVVLVLVFVVLPGSKVEVSIKNPASGSIVKDSTVKVVFALSNPQKAASVAVFLDQRKETDLDPETTEVEIPNPPGGSHTITLTAYDSNGIALSTATTRYNSEYNEETAGADLNDGYISSVTASSWTNDAANSVSYPPEYIRDNNETTCWAADLRDDPSPSLVFSFNQPVKIDSVYAIPGYKKFSEVDRYLQNAKPREVVLTFDDGTRETITFDLAPSHSALNWQTKPLTKPVTTSSVKATITDSYPGQNMGGGHSASSDVSISEFHFLGSPSSP
jgi:eukaryotic-like serine/threonine-protein kinase